MDFIEFKKRFEHKKVVEQPNLVSVKPLLSICVQTYQHVDFIKQGLDSILMQKTDFEFEVLLGEDDSSDGTREICLEYAKKHPHKIRLFLHHRENNISIGGSPTGRFILMNNIFSSNGRYIALFEGDDYWTDPYKLQKQVDFLEDNPSYSACFTNAEIRDETTGQKNEFLKLARNRTFTVDEVIYKGGGLFPTASLIFRNDISDWPDFVFEARSGDRALSLVMANFGEFYYLEEKTSVYRQHQGGIFTRNISNRPERQKIILDNIKLLRNFNQFSGGRNKKAVGRAISELSKRAILYGDYKQNLKNYDLFKNLTLKDILSLIKYCVTKKMICHGKN